MYIVPKNIFPFIENLNAHSAKVTQKYGAKICLIEYFTNGNDEKVKTVPFVSPNIKAML